MDAFRTHQEIINSYKDYIKSFMSIRDARIRQKVEQAFQDKGYIPEPLIQFNPSFAKGKSLQSLADHNKVHAELPKVFGSYNLYKHQVDALKIGLSGQGFIVTSGTGAIESLASLV